jgi:ribose 1,5-bisphosphokinase PhnN
VLASRLARRGRETPDSIRQRLARGSGLPVAGPDVLTIDNAGPIEQAGEILVAALTALPTGPPFGGKEKGQDPPEG